MIDTFTRPSIRQRFELPLSDDATLVLWADDTETALHIAYEMVRMRHWRRVERALGFPDE